MTHPLVSCLLPTFNRFPHHGMLLDEAVQCYLEQDYPNKELLICNDTPEQTLELSARYNTDDIRLYNLPTRFSTLGAKINWMLSMSRGEYICRWDDDDISLPWRLRYSFENLRFPGIRTEHQEWRPEQHWYWQGHTNLKGRIVSKSDHPGNTHIMSIWHRNILGIQVGSTLPHTRHTPYPGEPCPSGLEDQTFNTCIRRLGYPYLGTDIPDEKIFYIYRWGCSPTHLSGKGGGDRMNQTYAELASTIKPGRFKIEPRWFNDYVADARRAVQDIARQPIGLAAAP